MANQKTFAIQNAQISEQVGLGDRNDQNESMNQIFRLPDRHLTEFNLSDVMQLLIYM